MLDSDPFACMPSMAFPMEVYQLNSILGHAINQSQSIMVFLDFKGPIPGGGREKVPRPLESFSLFYPTMHP